MPSHKPFSSALNARCQGAISAGDFAGMVRVYAGTNTKLYRIIKTAVTDVSKAGGYATLPDVPWSFAVHGQRIIATNVIDIIKKKPFQNTHFNHEFHTNENKQNNQSSDIIIVLGDDYEPKDSN